MNCTGNAEGAGRKKTTGPLQHQAMCPRCNHLADFDYLGTQTWPERVAKRLGKPVTVTVWKCGNCQTTLSLDDI